MKSFYQFWKMVENRRRLQEFTAGPGGPSQGTDQGGGNNAAPAPPPMPANTASMGKADATNQKGVGPAIGVDALEGLDQKITDMEDSIKQAEEQSKASGDNPPPQLAQMKMILQQLQTLKKQMGGEDKNDPHKQDQQADNNRSKQNMTAKGPAPAPNMPAPSGGLGTAQPSPGAQNSQPA